MSRIKILHVVRNLGTGGTEEGVRKLLTGLDQSIFEQLVCAVVAGPTTDPITGARIVRLGLEPDQSGFLLPSLFRVFRREQPDVVHSRNWATIEAVPAARLARVPALVHSEHGLDVTTIRTQPWRRRAFRRMCLEWADCTFAVCNGLRSYYARQLVVSPERLHVIRNGVDTDRFRPDGMVRAVLRQRLQVSPSTMVVGTVSRLDPIKDHRTLFGAVERLVSRGLDLCLVIVGDGPERGRLQSDVQARPMLRGKTVFVGEVNNVPEWLNSFDVFVLPSLSEGLSNTLLEAMATELATIATRVGGNCEVIEHQHSGLLFEAGDVDGLADILKNLAADCVRRALLAKNGRERIQSEFSLQRMLLDYTGLYRQLTSRKTLATAALSGSLRADGATEDPKY